MSETWIITGEDARRLLAVLGDMPFGAIAYNAVPALRLIDKATPENRGAWLVRWLQALNETLREHAAHDRARDLKLVGYEQALRGLGLIIRDARRLLGDDGDEKNAATQDA